MSAPPDSVQFVSGAGGLPMIRVDGPEGWAEIYMHGAHVTGWGPSGRESLLWLSGSSNFDERTAIRGGVPVCFPWFGPLAGRPDAPRHGFARTAAWTFESAQDDGRDVTIRLRLSDSVVTRGSAWPHSFIATCIVVVGSTLSVALDVTNTGTEAVTFEEALHTYLSVADVTAVEIKGLEGVGYVDKNGTGAAIAGEAEPLRVADEVDRIYFGAPGTIIVNDVAGEREFRIGMSGSGSTVVWNPGRKGASATPDLDDEGWTTMLCVEASNVSPASVRLEPGAHHTMATTIAADPRRPARIHYPTGRSETRRE